MVTQVACALRLILTVPHHQMIRIIVVGALNQHLIRLQHGKERHSVHSRANSAQLNPTHYRHQLSSER